MRVLDQIVKAYDVRGTDPDQLDGDVAHALGVAFARFAGAPTLLVARDYDGGTKAWGRFTDGREDIVPGSRVRA